MNRREFMKVSGGVVAAQGLGSVFAEEIDQHDRTF